MGDSSGGGIGLALVQRLREEGREQPANIVLLCPWLDASLSNPEVTVYDKIDPFLDMEVGNPGGGNLRQMRHAND